MAGLSFILDCRHDGPAWPSREREGNRLVPRRGTCISRPAQASAYYSTNIESIVNRRVAALLMLPICVPVPSLRSGTGAKGGAALRSEWQRQCHRESRWNRDAAISWHWRGDVVGVFGGNGIASLRSQWPAGCSQRDV